MSGSVHVVVVNWNTGDHLRSCLASLALADQNDNRLARVTVIDNASTDGSAEGLDARDLPLEVHHNQRNVGFAAACNQGAKSSTADYLLFLNPDTRLFVDTLSIAIGFMDGERAAEVGICGVEILDADSRPGISCERFPTLRVLVGKATGMDRLLPRLFPSHHIDPRALGESGPVDQVIGAFFLVRRPLFDRLRGFDTRYFLYFEDVDFALRARQIGFRSYFLKEAVAIHTANVSSNQVRDVRLYHSARSRIIYARRHWPRWQVPLLLVLVFGIEFPARLVRAFSERRRYEVSTTLSAYRMLWNDLRAGAGLEA